MAAPNWVAAGKQASWLLSHFSLEFWKFCWFCDKKLKIWIYQLLYRC